MAGSSGDKRESKTGTRILIGLGFCAFLILLTGLLSQKLNPVRSFVYSVTEPVQKGFASAKEWLQDHTSDWSSMKQVLEENARLKETISALEEENRSLQYQARRAEELEALYGIDTYYRDYSTEAAQVIGLSPSNWYDSFLLDKGSSDGVELYMPVVTSSGLLGHVSEVYNTYSVVSTVISKDSVIYGQINRQDGDLLVVKGAAAADSSYLNELGVTSNEVCLVYFVTGETDIVVGDEIVTSSLGDIYPPGLSLGTVTEIITLGDGYESVAVIQPSVELSQTDMVMIIVDFQNEKDVDDSDEGGEQP